MRICRHPISRRRLHVNVSDHACMHRIVLRICSQVHAWCMQVATFTTDSTATCWEPMVSYIPHSHTQTNNYTLALSLQREKLFYPNPMQLDTTVSEIPPTFSHTLSYGSEGGNSNQACMHQHSGSESVFHPKYIAGAWALLLSSA